MENVMKTALFEAHTRLGGKMIDFAGWALPVQYEGLIEEHEAVRNQAGIFDVSHMGEVEVLGEEAFEFIQHLITNDISMLESYQISYSPMCYEDGGVIDDLLVYKYNKEEYLLVINASNTEKDYGWMLQQASNYDVQLKNLSQEFAQVAIQGPKAQEILQKLTDTDLSQIKFFRFDPNVRIEGMKCLVSRTGYTGEDGFELYCSNENVVKIWDGILREGKEYGLKPAGLGARDTLRFEAGLPLYGNEIDRDITPLEAGLGFFVKLHKDDFIGKEALIKQKAEGLKRKLVAFEMKKGIPRHGYTLLKQGNNVGKVTTGYYSPTLKKNIGLGLIEAEHSEIGEVIEVQIRKKVFPASIIKKGFYKKNYKK